MKHKHHITARYRGGDDNPNNIVELTPCQHAMWHFAEWQLRGDYRDYCAYKLILGDVNNPEFRKAASMRGTQAQQKLKGTEILKRGGYAGGPKGNKAQRAKLAAQGKTIAEKTWLITTPDNEQVVVTNLAKYCRQHNLNNAHLSAVSKGKRRHHRGYRVQACPT